jgi:hypothetical protein
MIHKKSASMFALVAMALLSHPATAAQQVEDAKVCKAAVAALMARDPRSISTMVAHDGVVVARYIKTTDGSAHEYRCRVSGDLVQWGTTLGGWRTRPKDELVTYRVVPGLPEIVIRIGYADGNFDLKLYHLDAL